VNNLARGAFDGPTRNVADSPKRPKPLAVQRADFFTAEVLRGFGLVRYYVFFVIDIATRRVNIAGITSQPSEAWMKQIGRNLTDCVDGLLKDTRYLILDRDPLYTHVFRGMLKDAGVKVVRLRLAAPT
jgi:putative transposase